MHHYLWVWFVYTNAPLSVGVVCIYQCAIICGCGLYIPMHHYLWVWFVYTNAPLSVGVVLLQIGHLQDSYTSVKQSLNSYPEHIDSKELLKDLEHHFSAL